MWWFEGNDYLGSAEGVGDDGINTLESKVPVSFTPCCETTFQEGLIQQDTPARKLDQVSVKTGQHNSRMGGGGKQCVSDHPRQMLWVMAARYKLDSVNSQHVYANRSAPLFVLQISWHFHNSCWINHILKSSGVNSKHFHDTRYLSETALDFGRVYVMAST